MSWVNIDAPRAASGINIRRWLDRNPETSLRGLASRLWADPARYVRYEREYLGWGFSHS